MSDNPANSTRRPMQLVTSGGEIVHAVAKATELRVWDTLIRTAGLTPGVLTDNTSLFTSNGARNEATTNLINGSTLQHGSPRGAIRVCKLGELGETPAATCREAIPSRAGRSERASGACRPEGVETSCRGFASDKAATSAQHLHRAGDEIVPLALKIAIFSGPSDQSHVVLALRVFVWFRNPILRKDGGAAGEVSLNGDYGSLTPWLAGGSGFGQAPGKTEDVYRLHWQAEEQLHWSFGTGLKNSIDNMPTFYLPAGKFFCPRALVLSAAAGEKPTSNGERSHQAASQRRAERCGNAAQGVETCTQPSRVMPAAKCGVAAGEEPARLNGGDARGASPRAPRHSPILPATAECSQPHGRHQWRHGCSNGPDPLAELRLGRPFGDPRRSEPESDHGATAERSAARHWVNSGNPTALSCCATGILSQAERLDARAGGSATGGAVARKVQRLAGGVESP